MSPLRIPACEYRHMEVALIAAMAANGTIGRDGALPWHLSEDLKHFKKVTLAKPVVMGRKTYQSIGKPLPGRTNIVVTRNPELELGGATVVHSLEEALAVAERLEPAETLIIGGAELYELALPRASRMYLTYVHKEVEGDTFFPSFDPKAWLELEREDHFSEKVGLAYSWVVLERR